MLNSDTRQKNIIQKNGLKPQSNSSSIYLRFNAFSKALQGRLKMNDAKQPVIRDSFAKGLKNVLKPEQVTSSFIKNRSKLLWATPASSH